MNNSQCVTRGTEGRRAVPMSLPLLAGALVLAGSMPLRAVEAPAAPPAVAERVQFADVIEAVQPAVVKIETTKRIGGIERLNGSAMPFGPDGPFGDFMRRFGGEGFSFGPQAVPPAKVEGMGSGFVVDPDGYIVTNNHVIDSAEAIRVTFAGGDTVPATVVGRDTYTDLAVLKVETKAPLAAVEFGNSDRARVGDWVVAIGNPFGLGGSVTAGIISARGRNIQSGPYDDYIQIDAPINSGSSGGPIIDQSGKVIGVNTAIYSPNGGNIGIGFAIPSSDAARIVHELRENGSVKRGWLGVQIQPVSGEIASALEIDEASGALVADVVAKSPASRAGLLAGDIIVKFDDIAIGEPRDLSRAVARTEPGSKSQVELLRNGKLLKMAIIIERSVAGDLAMNEPVAGDAGESYGLALQPLTEDARARLNLDETLRGALVAQVMPGSRAAESGLRPGDVIVRINRAEVDGIDVATSAFAAAKEKDQPVVVLVRRGDSQFFTSMKLS